MALGIAVVLIAPIALLLMRRRTSGPGESATSSGPRELSDPMATFEGQMASRATNQERLETEALLALKVPPAATKKSDILAKHLKKSVKADPVVSAQLLRTWMEESGPQA
jgi:flagellar biosynthesis/type III secretory pathway M-ring protein FliF/YscJ